MKKRHGAEAKEANAERWLITYADLMNNLLIFFIMLYSLSATDVLKFQNFMNSFNIAYNGEDVSRTPIHSEIGNLINNPSDWSNWYFPSGDPNQTGSGNYSGDYSGDFSGITSGPANGGKTGNGIEYPPGGYSLEDIDEFIKIITKVIKDKGYQNDIVVENVNGYVYFRFTEGVLFYGNQAVLKPTSYGPLSLIGSVLRETEAEISNIEIAGHTQYVPNDEYKTDFSSWELSAQRSITVLKYLVQNCDMPKTKMTIMGFSSTQPYTTGTTEEDKAKNRRVEIRIKRLVDNDKDKKTSDNTSGTNSDSNSTSSDTSSN
jgi:chemotaxis protein MotB